MSSLVLQGSAGNVSLPRGITRLAIPNVLLNNNCTVVGNTFKMLDAGEYLLDVALQLTAFGSDLAYTLELYNETDAVVVATIPNSISPSSAPLQQQFQYAFTADPAKFYSIRFNAPVGTNPFVAQINNNIAAQIVITSLTSTSGSGILSNLAVFRVADAAAINNSVALVADAILKFAIGANEVWQFTIGVFWNSATAALQFDLTGPAAPTDVKITENDALVAVAFSSALGPIANGNSGNNEFKISGVIQNGATPGTVTLRYAQNAAVVEDTVIQKGSYLIATRLA